MARYDIGGGNLMKMQETGAGGCATGTPYNPTLRERLLSQKADLTQRLANVANAIEALDANPNFEQVLDVIGKVNTSNDL